MYLQKIFTLCFISLFLLIIPNRILSLEHGRIQFVENISSLDKFPTVSKCCGLEERLLDGKCIKYSEEEDNGIDSIGGAVNQSEALHYESIVFRLKVSMPECITSSSGLLSLAIDNKSRNRTMYNKSSDVFNAQPGEGGYEDDDWNFNVVLTREGTLMTKDKNGFIRIYTENSFCIDQMNEDSFLALVCEPICNDTYPCIRKCCSPGSILDIDNTDCFPSRDPWIPFLHDTTLTPMHTHVDPSYVYGIPNCDFYAVSPELDPSTKQIYILTNGSLVTVGHNGRRIMYPLDTFCVDGGITPQYSYNNTSNYSPSLNQIAMICYPPIINNTEVDWRYGVYSRCEIISSIFLLLTAIVYLLLWEYQNIHGWLQFAYVGSSFFSFTFLAIVQIYTNEIHDFDTNLCESMGAVIHFSFLAAFFWLTSLNFDLWWTFSGCRPLRPSSKTGEKKRFFIFAIFSWGFPGIIAGIGLVLDYIYKNDPGSNIIRPRFGERKCYFYGSSEQLPYFYGPVGILLLIDLIFFFNTIYSLQKLQKDTKFATRQSSKQDKKRFVLFMKIFIVMGVLWIFEVISWIFEVYSTNPKLKLLFIPFDIINALQGLWIFIIFTCKPNTCRQLEMKFKKYTTTIEILRDDKFKIFSCFCSILLPILHILRRLFSICGHRGRSLENRRTRSNTTTLNSNTFTTTDKSRKFSDSSSIASTNTNTPLEMDYKSSSPM